MIDAQQAVGFAKQHAVAMLGERFLRLEEIERDLYKGRDVWTVTLGFVPEKTLIDAISTMGTLGLGPLDYKVFLIDASNGELVAMKLREPVVQ